MTGQYTAYISIFEPNISVIALCFLILCYYLFYYFYISIIKYEAFSAFDVIVGIYLFLMGKSTQGC